MKVYIIRFLSLILIVTLCNCVSSTLGLTGRGIDSLSEQKYQESCDKNIIKLIPKYPMHEFGISIGMLGDIYISISTGGVLGASYFILSVFGIGLSSHPPRPVEKPLEGWAGNYENQCRSNAEYFYKSYRLAIQSSDFKKNESDENLLLCQTKLRNIADETLINDMLRAILKKEITNEDLLPLKNSIRNNNDMSIKKAICEFDLDRQENSFTENKSRLYNCSCIFYVKISGGKSSILNLL